MWAAQRGRLEFSGRWLCWRRLLSGATASVAAGVYGFFPRNGLTSGAFVCGVAAVDRSLQMRSGGLHVPRRRPAGILGPTKLKVAASVRPKIVPAILRSARAGSARRAFDHRSARREAGGRQRSHRSDAALCVEASRATVLHMRLHHFKPNAVSRGLPPKILDAGPAARGLCAAAQSPRSRRRRRREACGGVARATRRF
jgi:hypothetical protein